MESIFYPTIFSLFTHSPDLFLLKTVKASRSLFFHLSLPHGFLRIQPWRRCKFGWKSLA
jgi:hypothetical protein